MGNINKLSKSYSRLKAQKDLRQIKEDTQRKQMQPLSHHRTKVRAIEASKRYPNPSYIRRDTSPSPYRYVVWKRRR